MEDYNLFEEVLNELRDKKILTREITDKIVKIFSMERFLLAMEKITLNQIQKFVFKPSGRILWVINGKDHDYLVYPKKYCSCMDFYLQGIMKNNEYFCKHLIAQAIFENLDSSKIEKVEKTVDDKEFDELSKEILRI